MNEYIAKRQASEEAEKERLLSIMIQNFPPPGRKVLTREFGFTYNFLNKYYMSAVRSSRNKEEVVPFTWSHEGESTKKGGKNK